jgi:signal transduction histidine kinase
MLRRWSLQSLLITLAVLVTLFAWAAGGALVWRVAEEHTRELHDGQLRHVAHLLLGLSGHELIEMGPDTPLAARIANGQADGKETLGEDYRYQLWSTEGRLLLTNFGLPSAAAMAGLGKTGYSWLEMDGQRWRVYALVDTELGQELQVAERSAARSWLVGSLNGKLLAMVVLSLVLVLVPALFMLRLLMRPLRQLAQQLGIRSASNLSQLELPGAPTELRPIVAATNSLFNRMAEAMHRERSFTSLAAHELRTPLAALRLQAQVAASTDDAGVRARNLRDLVRSADRCAHLQEQLLTLARLDAAKPGDLNERVDMTEALMQAVSEIATEARRRKLRLVTHSDGVTMFAHPFGVRTLIRNLVSNAARHAPEQGRVEVHVEADGQDVCLRVEDSGAGIPADQRERAFERFERLNATASDGVGLGLAIVRAVADAHGADVTLGTSELGGLAVRVWFRDRKAGTALAGDEVMGMTEVTGLTEPEGQAVPG